MKLPHSDSAHTSSLSGQYQSDSVKWEAESKESSFSLSPSALWVFSASSEPEEGKVLTNRPLYKSTWSSMSSQSFQKRTQHEPPRLWKMLKGGGAWRCLPRRRPLLRECTWRWNFSEVRPMRETGWNGAGGWTTGGWELAWAACVRSGWKVAGGPCVACGLPERCQTERTCPACLSCRAPRNLLRIAYSSWTCWTSCGCVFGCPLFSWSLACWPTKKGDKISYWGGQRQQIISSFMPKMKMFLFDLNIQMTLWCWFYPIKCVDFNKTSWFTL